MKAVTRFKSDNGEIYDFAIQAQRADKEHKDDKQILIDKINNITNMIHDDIRRGKRNRIYVDEQTLQDYLMLHTEDRKLIDELIWTFYNMSTADETNKLEEK